MVYVAMACCVLFVAVCVAGFSAWWAHQRIDDLSRDLMIIKSLLYKKKVVDNWADFEDDDL
jgi:hypothetical protein